MAFRIHDTVVIDDNCYLTANGVSINKGFTTSAGVSSSFNLATMPFIKTDGVVSQIFLDSSGKIPFQNNSGTIVGV